MPSYFERYQQGFYQEVYDELVTMQEAVFEEAVYQEAKLIAQEIMKRIRANIEMLIPCLKSLGYQFVDGDWTSYQYDYKQGKLVLSSQQDTLMEEKYRILREPPAKTTTILYEAEQLLGTLPLVVKSWYEEVGSINLIGVFPATPARTALAEELDPLLILPLEDLLDQFPFETSDEWEEARDEEGLLEVDLAVDTPLKYNASGSGGYAIKAPCRAFDTTIDLIYYEEVPTFVNYLRACFQWGGMFGLSRMQSGQGLTEEELAFLTQDLLPF